MVGVLQQFGDGKMYDQQLKTATTRLGWVMRAAPARTALAGKPAASAMLFGAAAMKYFLFLYLAGACAAALAETAITIETSMPPPDWALAQRALLAASGEAAREFAEKLLDPWRCLGNCLRR